MSYYKTSSGLSFNLCAAFCHDRKAAYDRLNAIIKKYNATPGRMLSCGSHVDGLHFGTHVPAGWRKTKGFPGYGVPSKTTKLGVEIAKELDSVGMPSPEKLARDLGCKGFFTDFDDGKMYCANIGVMESGGVYYLDAHKWCPPDLKKFPEITEILASEWHLADEASEKGKK